MTRVMDQIAQTLIFSGFAVAGIIAIVIGRTLPTAQEEAWKDNWRRWIFGPPGYNRVSTLMIGFILILIATVGVIVEAIGAFINN